MASVLYLSHGGGPLPLLGDPQHGEMATLLQRLGNELPRPNKILLCSAHWEASQPTLTGSENPTLIYDYYGFPAETYQLSYPAAGDPTLAASLAESLREFGVDPVIDSGRGYDHGMFVPLMLMYPQADIPVVQLSLLSSLNAEQHLQLGEALRPVLDDNVMVIGSGFSFHNMREFFAPARSETASLNREFDQWLQDTVMPAAGSYGHLRKRLCDWESAPGSRFCHPREEHLLPLHVCAGVAGRTADEHYGLQIIGKQASMFFWRGKNEPLTAT